MIYKVAQTQKVANPNLLRNLRNVIPHKKTLTLHQSFKLAESQADLLRKLYDITDPYFPHEIFYTIPKIKIVFEINNFVAASSHWNGTNWIIALSAKDVSSSQRLHLAHEIKHILDHPIKHKLISDTSWSYCPYSQSELLADYFAYCLYLPANLLKSEYHKNPRVNNLAKCFGVSPKVIRHRLRQLNL